MNPSVNPPVNRPVNLAMNSSSTVFKGLLLAALQVVLVASLGAKLLYDRSTRPRAWAQAQAFDPNLPIRGRYLSEVLVVPAVGFPTPSQRAAAKPDLRSYLYDDADLEVRNGQLIAVPATDNRGEWITLGANPDGTVTAQLREPVLFFISDTAKLPAILPGQLWVEVTVPAYGPPRPLRLAIKDKATGALTPLP